MLGRKEERAEGEGKKFAPFSPLTFEFQHGAFASKTFAGPKKTSALQACSAGYTLGSDTRVTSNGSQAFPLLIRLEANNSNLLCSLTENKVQ